MAAPTMKPMPRGPGSLARSKDSCGAGVRRRGLAAHRKDHQKRHGHHRNTSTITTLCTTIKSRCTDGLEHQPSQTRQKEHVLDDDAAGQQERELHATMVSTGTAVGSA